ncbi:hypothetical protein Tco_1185915 [Tanacetum coccineum]
MKIQWLKDGDQNSAYFHNSLKDRMVRNRIKVIYDFDGNKYEGDDIAPKFVDHFHKFLGSEDEVFPIEDLDSLFLNKLDAQCAEYMVRPILDDEIKLAMFSIEDDKAAGPDGYSSKFFKLARSIVRGDVCAIVNEFFYSSKLLGEFNANLISLVIINRLKEGHGSIVDSNQIAFIPGRRISDNILLAQEFMHGYGYKGRAQWCAFKVDIKKTYDTMNWEFLKIALHKFGFYSFMIKWIMVCLTTASFSICVNGEMHGFFKDSFGRILRRALDKFSMSSGLYPSMAKSTVFYSNVSDDVKEDIHLAMPFREGELPVRTDSSSGIASVSWKSVYRPKSQGGLGMKSLRVMNCALMVKHLWYISSMKESLLVKWLNVYRLKGECLWDMKIRDSFSWNLKQILKLRDNIRSYGFDLNAKVADLIRGNVWNWPSKWSDLFSEFINVPVPVLSQDSVDKTLEDLSCVWAEIVSGISVRKANNTLWSIIQRLVFGAAVYFILQERNFRLFRSVERPTDKFFDIIMDTVRLRLLGLKIKCSSKVDKAAAIWKIPIKGVLLGAILVLELGILAWERCLLFSVPMLVITPRFGEVGWGGFGFHFWDGVIREYRVELSNDPVLMHRICRVRWFFLSLRDSQSFLYIVYGQTWVISFVPLGSGGIRGVRLCSDKRRHSRLPLVDYGFVRFSPWEGCKPGLDVSIFLGMLGCTPSSRLEWFTYWSDRSIFLVCFFKEFSAGLVRIQGSYNVQIIKARGMLPEMYKGYAKC